MIPTQVRAKWMTPTLTLTLTPTLAQVRAKWMKPAVTTVDENKQFTIINGRASPSGPSQPSPPPAHPHPQPQPHPHPGSISVGGEPRNVTWGDEAPPRDSSGTILHGYESVGGKMSVSLRLPLSPSVSHHLPPSPTIFLHLTD